MTPALVRASLNLRTALCGPAWKKRLSQWRKPKLKRNDPHAFPDDRETRPQYAVHPGMIGL